MVATNKQTSICTPYGDPHIYPKWVGGGPVLLCCGWVKSWWCVSLVFELCAPTTTDWVLQGTGRN